MAEFANPDVVTTASTVSLGVTGGALSLVFGGSDLTLAQKIGCVVSGGVLAYVAVPTITVVWPEAPKQIFGIAGFFAGLIGMNVVRGVLAWGKRAEKQVPDAIDKRLGTDTKETQEKP